MNREKVIWWVLGLNFVLLCLGFMCSMFAIGDAYGDGLIEGKKEIVADIFENVNEKGYVTIYSQANEQGLELIEYNYSQELCLNSLGEIFDG